MENNINNRDFEQFIKQNADQYRMFPSEKVWSGIHNTLHTRRRWFSIGLALLMITTGTVTWIMLSPSEKKQIVSDKQERDSRNLSPAVEQTTKNAHFITSFARSNKDFLPFITGVDNRQTNLFSVEGINVLNNIQVSLPTRISQKEAETRTESKTVTESILIAKAIEANKKEAVVPNPFIVSTPGHINNNYLITELNNKRKVNTANENTITEKKELYPLSIKNVVNSYMYSSKRKKLYWQVFFAPTISYRRLIENKTFLNPGQSNNSPYNFALFTDINSIVTHKPDIGFELGFTVGYPVSKNLKIIVGLQFNVSKYDIRAYSHPSEIATIALNNSGSGISNSVSTITNYRNFNGNNVNWLHNLYLSASVPVGAEIKIASNKKVWIGASGSLQPTYILGDRAYLISTDYKNYAEVPWLIRKWNVNSSFETFAAYSTGKINWKVGPQVRYQLLSSFQEKYPVKEHLFDFGLKVGIMLNK